MTHKCWSHNEWLENKHYFCSCGHVQWAHYTDGMCAHCICDQYNGEARPLTEYERAHLRDSEILSEEP